MTSLPDSHWSKLSPGQRRIGSDVTTEAAHSPATTSDDNVTLNHTCIKIADPDRSLRFYREVLGFEPVMTWNTGPQMVFFLSQPVPDLSAEEVFKSMQSRSGLIELLYLHGTKPSTPPSDPYLPSLGYFHIGLTVRSVESILAKATAFSDPEVKIIKPLGRPSSMAVMGLPADTPAFHESTNFIFERVAFITDPDGNWIELVPKEMHKAKNLEATTAS